MNLKSHAHIYDTIGRRYRSRRQPDPRIARTIRTALGDDARTLCNIGAGSGSYEPEDIAVTAVEPSETMISQRRSPTRVVRARAEELPFEDNEFDVAMAILSVHHWEDPVQGLVEMRRVSKRQVVFTFNQEMQNRLWLVEEYLPEIVDLESGRGICFSDLLSQVDAREVIDVPIPHDCVDGFQAAYWRRPELYLDAEVQANISTFAQLPPEVVSRGMARLKSDIDSGVWARRHAFLLEKESFDFGYRIVISN